MNLSRVSNPPKTRFQLSAGLNFEKFNTILSETNQHQITQEYLSVGLVFYSCKVSLYVELLLYYSLLDFFILKISEFRIKVIRRNIYNN